MARYIIIDAQGQATLLDDRNIQKETTALLASGESFQVFEAMPLSVEISLRPSKGPATLPVPSRRKKKTSKRSKKAAKRGARKTAKAGPKKGKGKPGRPRLNVGSCTQSGCSKPAKTRGLCSAHYQKHRRLVQAGKPGLIPGGVVNKKKGKATKAKTKTRKAAKATPKPAGAAKPDGAKA